MISGDVCVPISKFAEMVEYVHATGRASERGDLRLWPCGDGNLHTETLARKRRPDEFSRGIQATDEIVRMRWRWVARWPASTAWAWASGTLCDEEHGPSLAVMQGHQGGHRSPGDHEPRQDLSRPMPEGCHGQPWSC